MYPSPPPIAEATDRLWAFIARRLITVGMPGVPEMLDKSRSYDGAWLDSNLLLAHTCGYPYMKRLRGKVQLVATPVYDLPGCQGSLMRSFIVVRTDAKARSLGDLRRLAVAINDRDSNSGANLLRAAIAPLARDGRFFSSVVETGSHLASMEAVAAGNADVAAIDCVTFGNTARFDPARVANLRTLAETEQGPGLPLITGARTTEEELRALRAILAEAAEAPELTEVRDILSLRGFDILTDQDYARLTELENRATASGYPDIA